MSVKKFIDGFTRWIDFAAENSELIAKEKETLYSIQLTHDERMALGLLCNYISDFNRENK